jgi:hypothetical protein
MAFIGGPSWLLGLEENSGEWRVASGEKKANDDAVCQKQVEILGALQGLKPVEMQTLYAGAPDPVGASSAPAS